MAKIKNPLTVIIAKEDKQFANLVDGSIEYVSPEDLESVTTVAPSAFRERSHLRNVALPSSVTSIGLDAFRNCTSLTTVIIPSSITSIGSSAFNGCTSLTGTLRLHVGTISNQSFRGTALTKIIAINPTKIEAQCFYQCTYLEAIVIDSQNAPVLDNPNAFNSIGNSLIYVPFYTTTDTNWATVSSKIRPLVATVADLSNIDTTTYTKACVRGSGDSYNEYTYDGSAWSKRVV